MAPVAVAAAIAMLFIILGVSEYMRLVITAAGIKDAMESAVVSVVNDNYNEVYHGVREGYAAGYEPDDTGFAASVTMGISMAGCVFCLVWKRMGTVMSAITTVVNWSTAQKSFCGHPQHGTGIAGRNLLCGCRGHDGSACAFRRKNLVEYVGQVEGEGSLQGEI